MIFPRKTGELLLILLLGWGPTLLQGTINIILSLNKMDFIFIEFLEKVSFASSLKNYFQYKTSKYFNTLIFLCFYSLKRYSLIEIYLIIMKGF